MARSGESGKKAMIRLAVSLALLLPALLWWSAVGDPRVYLDPSVPDGQLLYALSKLAALCAVALFALQLALTVLRGTPLGPSGNRWRTGSHARLGAAVLFASVLHVALFVAAASLRSGHVAAHLLLPRWSTGFYDRMVSIGALALLTMLLVVAAGALARRVGRTGRHVHRLLVPALVPLVLVHSYAIGSETDTLPVIAFYVLVAVVGAIGLGRATRGVFRR